MSDGSPNSRYKFIKSSPICNFLDRQRVGGMDRQNHGLIHVKYSGAQNMLSNTSRKYDD